MYHFVHKNGLKTVKFSLIMRTVVGTCANGSERPGKGSKTVKIGAEGSPMSFKTMQNSTNHCGSWAKRVPLVEEMFI